MKRKPLITSAILLGLTCSTLSPALATEQKNTSDVAPPVARSKVQEDTSRLVITYENKTDLNEVKNVVSQKDVPGQNVTVVKDKLANPQENQQVIDVGQNLNPTEQQKVIDKLESQPDIKAVYPDKLVKASASVNTEPYAGYQFNLQRINAESAWDVSTGKGQTIAVIDQGQVRNHPDSAQQVPGYDFISDNAYARDGGGRDNDPTDMGSYYSGANSTWHGQHVAGIASAPRNGRGVAGVAPESKIQHLRVLGTAGSGWVSDFADAIYYASGKNVPGVGTNPYKASVINLSMAWGSDTCEPLMGSAINYAHDHNIPITVAAGNDGANANNYTPANCLGAIVVGASTSWNTMTSYSNYGSMLDVVAPGGTTGADIYSTIDVSKTSPVAPGYGALNGTSMATPHVSGAIADMKSVNPALTVEQIRTILTSTSTTNIGGYPQINVQQAVKKAQALAPKPATTYSIVNGFRTYYNSNGGLTKFGTPTQNEFTSVNNGAVQNFSKGWAFYWHASTDTHAMKWGGAIGNYYQNQRWELGRLGYPSSDEESRVGGAVQTFHNPATGYDGYVYWSANTGAHELNGNGGIYKRWVAEGAYNKLGYPTTNEINNGSYISVKFSSGKEIRWTAQRGTWIV